MDDSKPATVKLSIDFSDLQVVTPGTKSAGDAIGKMTNICVLFYKPDGTLAIDGAVPIYHYAGNISASESVNMTKTVPAGTYKVVAVANMGNLVTNSAYQAKIQKLADLKSISLQWNNQHVAANNQMFGFFNTSLENSIDDAIMKNGMNQVAPTGYDAPELALSGNKTLYAKLYRTVAKVTVAFNGEGLNSNVFVTVKSIRLGNLPASCPLWVENQNIKDTVSTGGQTGAQGEMLTETDFGLLRVTNRGAGNESLFPKNAHSQTGPSLFMFENRQGTAPTSGDKEKIKTKKPYGAYIEIEAHYANESTGSNGKIIYRYMLGEDTPGRYDNYNLTRNRHYKVTLLLQKSGKEDPYWRVEYYETPSVNLPTEVNISYRNSAQLNIPFTVTETNGGVQKVEAKIIENPWYDDLVDGYRDANVVKGAYIESKYGFLAWNGQQSSNGYWASSKTLMVPITKTGDKYQLAVQTEALGFKTGTGEPDSFTGYNNYSNPRTAKIAVTISYGDGTTKTVEVKVVQVPRIVNPIAVYRRWNNDAPFNIRLLNARGEEIESYGPWEAEVESGKDWIRIKRNSGSYGTSITSGAEGGAIRFDYKPLSKLGSDTETRCGVIVVRFSNYNVEHKIYVRQGYAPTVIGTGENLWTSYNYIGVNANNEPQFASSPMEEGAWLRSGNSVGILADNNSNTDGFDSPPSSFKTSNGNNLPWYQIGQIGDLTAPFTAPGYALPTQEDILNLRNLRESSGFGIGYDDNATQTEAFDEAAQYTNPAMGRRGFVICDAQGRNLFFPTGKRGYGRRRNAIKSGGLHYAHATTEPSTISRPALYGLPKSMGAIYWANGTEKLSLNYSLSNIETANGSHNDVGIDACFARLIKVSNITTFEKYYTFRAWIPVDDKNSTVSITHWGEVTDSAISQFNGQYRVSFKYNIENEKTTYGVTIKVIQYNRTYEKKLSMLELERIAANSTIILDEVKE